MQPIKTDNETHKSKLKKIQFKLENKINSNRNTSKMTSTIQEDYHYPLAMLINL